MGLSHVVAVVWAAAGRGVFMAVSVVCGQRVTVSAQGVMIPAFQGVPFV